jgi:hypothetical protein
MYIYIVSWTFGINSIKINVRLKYFYKSTFSSLDRDFSNFVWQACSTRSYFKCFVQPSGTVFTWHVMYRACENMVLHLPRLLTRRPQCVVIQLQKPAESSKIPFDQFPSFPDLFCRTEASRHRPQPLRRNNNKLFSPGYNQREFRTWGII